MRWELSDINDDQAFFVGQKALADVDLPPEELVCFKQILEIVHERKGLDFSYYRVATLVRRVRNRMIAAKVHTFQEYLSCLLHQPDETDALVEKLTLKVSCFFRDPDTFRTVKQAILRRPESEVLRMWSAGCGHGEEPYSLAIMVQELARSDRKFDIVATDVDRVSLNFAGQACYPISVLKNLDPHERERYFHRGLSAKGHFFYLKPEIRQHVTFSYHDLATSTEAPDEGKFDLVMCRNVLIYFQPVLQEKVEKMLIASLLPGGLLCLGEAEWIAPQLVSAVEVVDRKARLFRKRR